MKNTLSFSDGMTFNLDGPPRITMKSDGLYVVGNGMLIPVNNYEEGQEIINNHKKEKQNENSN